MKTDHTVSVNIKLNQVLLTVISVYFSPHGDFSKAINQLNLYKGSSPIPLVFNDCSPPSCLSPSEVEVVFRKLHRGKAPGIDLIDYAIWKALL
ncbi:hypothetical protein TNCV_3481091 [Trichonephila clavipes]|nr:hypothetical protein TNCV_3481091 [Trichonephila clavipes]